MEISRKMVKIFDLSEHTGLLWIKTVHLETTTYILYMYMNWLNFKNHQKKWKSFEFWCPLFLIFYLNQLNTLQQYRIIHEW